MGKWDHRPSRRFFRQRRSPVRPSKFYDINAPLPDFCQDGIPLWEKKYCTLIGPVAWQKIVDSKRDVYCHGNVFNWNDSAAEEAFQNAKKRYWAKINSLPCDIALPDPDTYNDQIDWNPYVDSELVKEVDSAYFALPDEEHENAVTNKRTKISVNGESTWECTGTPLSRELENEAQGWNQGNRQVDDSRNMDNQDNPWESSITHVNAGLTDSALKSSKVNSWGLNAGMDRKTESKDTGTPLSRALENEVQGWNQGNHEVGDSRNMDNGDNPWESSIARRNAGLTDSALKSSGTNSWGLNAGTDHKTESKDWNCGYLPKDKGWGKFRDSSWCQPQSNNYANARNSSWECKSSRRNITPNPRNTGWENSAADRSGWKQQGNADVSRNYGGWTAWPYWRGEGSNQQYNGSQFQLGHNWRGQKGRKRGFIS